MPQVSSTDNITASNASADKQTPLFATDEIRTGEIIEENDASEETFWSFWRDLRDSLPPWLDEIIAIGLLLFGVLSFIALTNSSQAVVAVAWSNIITNLFGYGGIMISAGVFALGVIMLLPRIGMSISLSPTRILALEIAFLSMLAILHITTSEAELRAVARAGQGGGIIGWGLSILPYWLMGRTPALILFSIILAASVAVVVGVRHHAVVRWFKQRGRTLIQHSETILRQTSPRPPVVAAPTRQNPVVAPPDAALRARTPLMRIRPNLDNLPPSLRNPQTSTTAGIPLDELEQHPLFLSKTDELKADYNIIGEVTTQKSEDGHLIVRRPDGREKRYFSVKAMAETKKISRRERTLPTMEILQDIEMQPPDENEINHNVVLIENTLLEFDINIDVVDVQVGPTVTRYAVQPYRVKPDGTTERTRLSKIASFQSDLSLTLSAKRLRLEVPVPGTSYMGIEVPNRNPSTVALRSVYESKDYFDLAQKSSSPLLIPLGRDVSGRPVAIDIAKMPHLLIAGTTGSGKSVCIAAVATALLLNNTPDVVKMVMLDPKMVELSRFNGAPHLLGPVETDTDRIIGVLKWCTREMDRRYKLLEEHAVRNIDNYNAKFGARRRGRDYMPYIVILIDEIGDLMMSRPEETETAITRLAQMARAVGMHLIVATQRPSVDVITGLIKANFPGRISFAVASGVDSRVILDATGAESLLGKGDMLYMAPDAPAPKRVQGCYVDDEEVRGVVQYWRDWYDEQIEAGKMERARTGPWERGLTRREFLAETDPMLEEAIEFVVETQEASASILQRRLGLGYPRAARIVDMLHELGVVGEPVGGGRARKVLIARGEDPFKRIIEQRMTSNTRKRQEEDEQDEGALSE